MVRRIGLVGCVKKKAALSVQAQDLYVSALFVGRRRYVEASCDEWWILSAKHGLVHPEDLLEPYDLSLKQLGRSDRRTWSEHVLRSFDERVGSTADDVVEIHAGAEYREFGLVDGLKRRGLVVENPTLGLPIGPQLSFYKEATRSES